MACLAKLNYIRSMHVFHDVAVPLIVSKFQCYKNKGSVEDCSRRILNYSVMTSSNENISAKSRLLSILKIATDLGIREEKLIEVVEGNPELLNTPSSSWHDIFNVLQNNGFNGSECVQMISKCPKLLKVESRNLLTALDSWRIVQLGESILLPLLVLYPEFLFVNLKDLPKKINFLKSLGSKKQVVNLLRNCPTLMFESCVKLEEKVEYIENKMKLSGDKILKCSALNRSLIKLKTRHTFLDRAGKFIPPSPKKDVAEPSKNPSLKQIFDTDDLIFATQVAGLTLEEYEVFMEMYTAEVEETDTDSDIDN